MIEIRDINNKVVRRSKNLRGIRDYARTSRVLRISVNDDGMGGGVLRVTYYAGETVRANFASIEVLHTWVRRWYSAQGALLYINGTPVRSVLR